jgi:hypothetical protein
MKFSKKLVAGIAAAAVLSVSGIAMAAGRPAEDTAAGLGAGNENAPRTYAVEDGTGYGYGNGNGYAYSDADGDGVCDNTPALDGSGNVYGAGGYGLNDADGDGVCDICGETLAQDGTGSAYGAGNGSAYRDADGDGVCDGDGVRALDGSGSQTGRGYARSQN